MFCFSMPFVPADLVLVDHFSTTMSQSILPEPTVVGVTAGFGAASLIPGLACPSSLLCGCPPGQTVPTGLSGVAKTDPLVVTATVPASNHFRDSTE